MMGKQGQAAEVTLALSPVSAANTAAATTLWIDVRHLEGDIVIEPLVGAFTGSLQWTVEDATDGAGTGAAAVTPNEGAWPASSPDEVVKRTINASAVRGWIQVIGTIVTGPAVVGITISGHPKYT